MKGKNEFQSEINVFLISDEWNDFNNHNRLIFWGVSPRGPVKLVYKNRPVFFVDRSIESLELPFPIFRKEVRLKSFSDNPVDAIYFNTQNDLLRAAEYLDSKSIRTYESDINPTRRFLMERGINVQVKIEGNYSPENGVKIFQNPKILPDTYSPELKIASLDIETNASDNSLYSYAIHFKTDDDEKKLVRIIGEEEKQLNKNVYQCL